MKGCVAQMNWTLFSIPTGHKCLQGLCSVSVYALWVHKTPLRGISTFTKERFIFYKMIGPMSPRLYKFAKKMLRPFYDTGLDEKIYWPIWTGQD
jgi:hypothetical protein